MNILRVDLNFHASDTCRTTIGALRELIVYLEAETCLKDPDCAGFGETYDSFRWNMQNCDARVTGRLQLAELPSPRENWRIIEEGVPGGLTTDTKASKVFIK